MRVGRTIGMAGVLVASLLAVGGAAAGAAAKAPRHAPSRHVVLLSIDGLHQSDLTWWISHHPNGPLASMSRAGTEYSNAQTPVPSDSFPGLIAQLTGGDPRTTGIYYDDSYNRRLLPPGPCTPGQTTGLGTEVNFSEAIARDPDSIDSGLGIPDLYAGLPSGVLALPGGLRAIERGMINTAALPVSPRTCRPVYPHQYLRVNTVFGVLDRAGLRTAWSDKHAAYELVNGPGGRHVSDLFTPEINSSMTDPSLPAGPGPDWTTDNRGTQFYDAIKVQAVINEIRGFDHSGRHHVGTPALLGMNFQSVSTAEKLPLSPLHGADARGGYVLSHGRWVPGPVLRNSLGFVDREVGRMTDALNDRGLLGRTTFIVSAKHGQSPIEASALKRIDDGNVIDALNAAWTPRGGTGTLVAFAIDDDAMLIWLNDRSPSAIRFARHFLLHYSQPASAHVATDYAGNPIGFRASGLQRVAWGPAYFGVSQRDARVPDLYGIVQHGVVYTGKTSKIAEHGGQDAQDRDVPILVIGPGFDRGVVRTPVETTEIAPTILRALGISPDRLAAVRIQHTPALPCP